MGKPLRWTPGHEFVFCFAAFRFSIREGTESCSASKTVVRYDVNVYVLRSSLLDRQCA